MAEASSKPQWRPIACMDPVRLMDARLQGHHALQWLARVARAHVAPQPDDGHTCLHWEGTIDAFATQTFAGGTRLLLQVPKLTLALESGAGMAGSQSFALDGRTDAQARQWLHQQFEARGFDPTALDAPAPYEIPMHAIGQGSVYDARTAANGLTNLAAWYANAAALIEGVRQQIAEHGVTASALCCWPHHFDLAILAMVPARQSAELGLVGVGLSPGDEYYDEPYYYVSVYPEPNPTALPALPAIGEWHTHHFTAAVATARRILAANSPEIETGKFLRGAVAASLRLVGQAS